MTDDRPLVLSIDLGTSGVKVACVRDDGAIASVGRAPIQTIRLPQRGAEQDAEAVWSAVLDACDQAIAGVHAQAISGVGVCSQFSSIVPVDSAGRPTMNMMLWLDQRGASKALRLRHPDAGVPRDSAWRQLRWLRIHGIPPIPSGIDSLSHMRFVRFDRPDVYERTHAFLEPMDYVTARLSGRITTNACSAFLMLLTDNRRAGQATWSDTLLGWSGVDRDKLPPLVDMDQPVGVVQPAVARRLGLRSDVAVYPAMNDSQAGGMASYAFSGTHAGLTIGTTGAMATHVGFKRTDIKNSIVSIPSPVTGTYFVMAENSIAGRALDRFLDHIVFRDDGFGDHRSADRYAAFHRAIEPIAPGSDRVLFLPWLNGTFTPIEDGQVRGGFLNLSLDTTREHMGLAVLEVVAMNFRWLRDTIQGFSKRHVSDIVFYGGGALSSRWSQVLADVLQVPVAPLVRPEYAACLGVGLTGHHRAGRLGLDDFSARVSTQAVYQPRGEHAALYDELFAQFVQAFKNNRDIFHALNPITG